MSVWSMPKCCSPGSSNLQSQKEVEKQSPSCKVFLQKPVVDLFLYSHTFLVVCFWHLPSKCSLGRSVVFSVWLCVIESLLWKKNNGVFMEWSGTSEVWRAFSFKALFHLLGRGGRFFRWLLCMGEVLCHYLKFGGGGEDRDERRAIDGLGKDGQIGKRRWL